MTDQEKETDASSRRPLAYLAATPYWFSEQIGDAQIGRSKDGREIAIYFDDATQESFASSGDAWRRMIDEEIDYSEWCSSADAIEVTLDDEDIFEANTAPDMSERDATWALFSSLRDKFREWADSSDALTDPDLEAQKIYFSELDRALGNMRRQR